MALIYLPVGTNMYGSRAGEHWRQRELKVRGQSAKGGGVWGGGTFLFCYLEMACFGEF